MAKKMVQLETAHMTVIWHTVLDRFNATSAGLQKADIDHLTAVKLRQSLITLVVGVCLFWFIMKKLFSFKTSDNDL